VRKSAFVIIFTLILVSLLHIGLVNADSVIYIKADGSIVPSTAPIERDGDVYSFTDRIFNQTIVVERSNIVIDGAGFKLEGYREGLEHFEFGSKVMTERGLHVIGVSNVTIQNMELQNFELGICIENSSDCVITSSTLTNDVKSLYYWYSNGFNLKNSSNCLIGNNTIINSCMVFKGSSNNIISNNTLHGGVVDLSLSYNNTFTENRIYDGNFEAGGYLGFKEMKDYMNSIDTSNQVNDAPVYYLVNQTNLTIDSNTTSQIGALVLVNCDNITIKDATIMQGMPTVMFAFTTNSALINCSVIDYQNHNGIVLRNSANNLISNNNITSYGGWSQHIGLHAPHSFNNTISDNFVAGSWWWGITSGSFDVISGNIITQAETGLLISEFGNTVFDNEVYSTRMQISKGVFADSGEGMQVSGANHQIFRNTFRNNGLAIEDLGSNITYYQNNFINNTKTVEVKNRMMNNWDNGTMGNYWSDYADRYPNAKEKGSSGIWDTPYIIDENNQDNYPLMNPTAFPETPDATPPTISIVSPENKTYSTNTLNLSIHSSSYLRLFGVQYSVDGGSFRNVHHPIPPDYHPPVSCDYNTVLDLEDGPHLILAKANVWSGITYANASFTIDTTSPDILVLSPENKTYDTADIPLNFTVNELVSQITYSLDGQENVAIDGNATLTELSDGSHSLIVYATDTVGNTGASETVHFSIEAPPPEPKKSEPFPITWIAAATAIIAIAGAILLIYFRKTKRP
jgi:nitrous oxidase accessory protein NosD